MKQIALGPHRLYHGDALDMMRELPDASVDAVVTDPPYCSGSISEAGRTSAKGQGLRSETISGDGRFQWFEGDTMGTAGLEYLLRQVAVESARILKPGGSLVVFVDWRMQSTIGPAMESAGLRKAGKVTWDKGSFGLGRGFRPQCEEAIHLTRGIGEYYSARVGNVIRVPRNRAEQEHPTQKPAELMRLICEVVSPRGGCVVDPFTGSGSTAVGAIQAGSTFIGAEREARFIEVATARILAAEAASNRDAAPVDGRASQTTLQEMME